MADCVFCGIAQHEIPSNIVYEDDKLICFHDLEPQAPVHVLVIPKKHISSLDDVKAEDQELLGYIMYKIHEIAAGLGLENERHQKGRARLAFRSEKIFAHS